MIKLYIAIIGNWGYVRFLPPNRKKAENHKVLSLFRRVVGHGTHNVAPIFSEPYYSTKFTKNQESKFWNGDDRWMSQLLDPKEVGAFYENFGKSDRVNFGKHSQKYELPNLINVQLES